MNSNLIGSHAVISMGFSAYNRPIVIKTFGKKDKIPSESKALELIQLHKRYQQIGLELGIPMNPSFDLYITENQQHTKAYINEIQPFVETNLVNILNVITDQDRILELLRFYLSCMQKVWRSNFAISLDPPLSNFGINEDRSIKYFDFYPAYQRLDDGSEFIWPNTNSDSLAHQFFKNRYFSSRQIWMIYAQLMRVLCIKKILSLEKIKNIIGIYLGNEAYTLIDIKPIHIDKILADAKSLEDDLLRVVACNLCYENKITNNQLKKIFTLTHVGADNKLPPGKNIHETINFMIHSDYMSPKKI